MLQIQPNIIDTRSMHGSYRVTLNSLYTLTMLVEVFQANQIRRNVLSYPMKTSLMKHYYRAAAYTLCRVVSFFKNQHIHILVNQQHQQKHKFISPKRER